MSTTKKVLMIDPSSGWKYGFPKAVPEEIDGCGSRKMREWLISEGLPEKLLEFPCGFWYEEVVVDNSPPDS